MSIGHLKVKHRARVQPEHRTASFQGFDFRIQHVLGPVDPLEGLPEIKLRAPERLEFLLGS
jgi:hypothetical protein